MPYSPFKCAHLNGEYGIKNVYAGVPVLIGNKGVEKIEEIQLDEKEKKEFLNSVNAVEKLWEAAVKIDPELNNWWIFMNIKLKNY